MTCETTTIKTRGAVPTPSELEVYRKLCMDAYEAYCEQRTIVCREIFFKRRDQYEHIKTLYAAGRAALVQKRVIERQ